MSTEPATALSAAAASRSVSATERARRALLELDRRGETITFVRVAEHAGVSRQFLYSNPNLRSEIERLRSKSQPAPPRLPDRERASDESIRARLRSALDEHKRLRDEIAALRQELALAHGRVRELQLAARTMHTAPATSTTRRLAAGTIQPQRGSA